MMDDDDIDQAMGMLDGILVKDKPSPFGRDAPVRELTDSDAEKLKLVERPKVPSREKPFVERPLKLGGTEASRKFGSKAMGGKGTLAKAFTGKTPCTVCRDENRSLEDRGELSHEDCYGTIAEHRSAPARGDARSAVGTDAWQPNDAELFIKLGSDGALILSVDVGGQRVSRTVFPNEKTFSALEVRGAICKLQDAVDALKDKK